MDKHYCEMKGFLSFQVLKMISKKPMSGQDLRQEFKQRKGCVPSPGTIYPVLKFLKSNKLIEEIKSTGKTKKYKLTKNGQTEVRITTERFLCIFSDLKDDFKKI